jgi:hypothetical protein
MAIFIYLDLYIIFFFLVNFIYIIFNFLKNMEVLRSATALAPCKSHVDSEA